MRVRNIILAGFSLIVVAALLALGLRNESASAETLVVYKSPSCGCCGKWIEHMEENGFTVEVRDMEDLSPIKDQYHVEPVLRSCHTALIGGYVVEGHVPASEVKRMIEEKPSILGIAVPGMPAGSPGMEQGDPADWRGFDVISFDKNGNEKTWAFIEAGR